MDYGWPVVIRSDGGPQFRQEFAEFCKNNSISHELSSPYNPESNGLAESAVKNLKSLVLKCNEDKTNLQSAITAWRNMAREDGITPSQAFFGRRQKQNLPLRQPDLLPQAISIENKDIKHMIRPCVEICTLNIFLHYMLAKKSCSSTTNLACGTHRQFSRLYGTVVLPTTLEQRKEGSIYAADD